MNKPVWNNTGDTVKLFNASGILQDSYAYTSDYDYCYLIPSPGEINDEVPSGGGIDCTPGVNIPGNKSYARIPNGTGPFVDPVPTPGVINSLNEANAPEILADVVEEILAPVFEPTPILEPAPEPLPAPEPTPEPTPEPLPILEPAPEPAPIPEPEPAIEIEDTPEVELESPPAVEPEAVSVESSSEPQAEIAPAPEPEPAPEEVIL